jgi:hypothetical protein
MSTPRGTIPVADWPADLRHPEVRGLFLGGCVARGFGVRHLGGGSKGAHAHTSGPNRGWICFGSTRLLDSREARLHELAHVVTREGHTARWREYLLQIGGTIDEVPGILRSYYPRKRARVVERVERDGWVHTHYSSGSVSSRPVLPRWPNDHQSPGHVHRATYDRAGCEVCDRMLDLARVLTSP